MKLSNLIKTKRIEKNMTMEELASLLGVNQSTITRLESGRIKSLKTDKALLLSKYLDIPLENLITRNFTMIQDGKNNVQELTINSNVHKKNDSKIYDIVDQLTDEGKEELLNYADYLLGKYKK